MNIEETLKQQCEDTKEVKKSIEVLLGQMATTSSNVQSVLTALNSKSMVTATQFEELKTITMNNANKVLKHEKVLYKLSFQNFAPIMNVFLFITFFISILGVYKSFGD